MNEGGAGRRGARVVWSNRGLRLLVSGAFLYGLAEMATWIAILVLAYDLGGPSAAGVAAAVQLVPAGLAAPIAGTIADRWRRGRLLTLSYALAALVSAIAAIVIGLGTGLPLILGLGAALSVLFGLLRPLQTSLVPGLAEDPAEVVAANGALGFAAATSYTVGPLVAAWLLGDGPSLVFLAMSVVLAVATLVVGNLGTETARPPAPADSAWAGFGELGRTRGALPLLAIAAAFHFTVGGLDILVTAVALDHLGIGDSGVGYLWAAAGLGGMAGASFFVGLAGRSRLTGVVVGAGVAWGISIALLGFVPGLLAGLVLLVVNGVAELVLDITGQTMLQRIVAPHLLSRAFGASEGLRQGALAVGALASGFLLTQLGVGPGAVVLGGVLPLVVLVTIPALLHVDRGIGVPWVEVEAIASSRAFSGLSVRDCETLAAAAERIELPGDVEVITEGDHAALCFVILEGSASVSRGGVPVADLGPGDHFGEIALLRDVPRTATVRTTTASVLLAVDRASFLEVVTGNRVTDHGVAALVDRRLGELRERGGDGVP